MKKVNMVVLVIVVILIIGVIIWAAHEDSQENTENESQKESDPTFLQRIVSKINKIQQEIDNELETLRLTTEMQEFLNNKINNYLRVIKFSAGVLCLVTFLTLASFGVEVWAALIIASTIVGLAFPLFTFFFFSRVMNIQEFIEWIILKIKQALFKKYGCDAQSIQVLKNNLHEKEESISVLQAQMYRNN